jgi:drug/metabolite transporter (DMT)-like permease
MGNGGAARRAATAAAEVDAAPDQNPAAGIACKILAALAFTIMSAGIKSVGEGYPTGELVFFRSAFALIPLAVWLAWSGHLREAAKTSDLKGHVLRGVVGSTGMFAGFVALTYLPLSDAVAIGYASPLITVVLAALILKETVRVYRWSAVAAGFVGVLIMLSPHLGAAAGGTNRSLVGAGFGLLGACCAAAATIQVRRLTSQETTGAIVLYFSLLTTALGLTTLAFGWRLPPLSDAPLLVGIGILGGIGQILMTQSYRFADASLVAPFDYMTMIWAILIGWFAFGQLPDRAVIVGGAVVALAGLFVIWREHRLGLARAKHVEAGAQRPT